MKIKAVILDMDGVVAETIPAHFFAWKKMLKEQFGYDLTKKYFFNKLNARQGPDIIKITTKQNISHKKRLEFTKLKDEYARELLKNIKPTPGLVSFLKFLKQNKIKIGLATSGQEENMKFFLTRTKTLKYFDVILTAKDIDRGKPHPQAFLKAAKKLKVKPSQAIVVEDALLGIKAIKAGKFYKAIGITTSHTKKQLKQADLVINNFKDKNLYNLIKPEIILASKSPARKKLLKKQFKNFRVEVSNINERKIKIKDPKKLALKLAELKAWKISKNNPNAIVIGTDTIGSLKNRIYGKPKTKQNYYRFVSEHSNNKIAVITGWVIIYDGKVVKGVETSWVYFNEITKQMADNYFKKYNPLEKGGGFNIEEIEKLGFVKKIIGDYDNIIGLPKKTILNLKKLF